MRYHYTKPNIYLSMYGELYSCNHPLYNKCTLYKIKLLGICVIQQRFDNTTKHTYWTEIDSWLTDDIYLNPGFMAYFNKIAKEPTEDGLYPTVTLRQIMWALKMKPIKKEPWETVFDRKSI